MFLMGGRGGLVLGSGGVCVSVLLVIELVPRIPRQRGCKIAFGGLGGRLRLLWCPNVEWWLSGAVRAWMWLLSWLRFRKKLGEWGLRCSLMRDQVKHQMCSEQHSKAFQSESRKKQQPSSLSHLLLLERFSGPPFCWSLIYSPIRSMSVEYLKFVGLDWFEPSWVIGTRLSQ